MLLVSPVEPQIASPREEMGMSATVPIVLDHNRMLVDAEFQRGDGTWRSVRLWVDSGGPDFIMSVALARDLGIDLSAAGTDDPQARIPPLEIPPPAGARLGGMPLTFEGVAAKVLFSPPWIFSTTHADANLPSTVLRNYRVVFDYPHATLTLAAPGTLRPRGIRVPAHVNARTGIAQIDAVVDGDSLSFALDNGASYSFMSQDVVDRLIERHPDWPHQTGALGCANIWGWWPQEESWPVLRLPEILWGPVRLTGVAIVGLPGFFGEGATLGSWYSQKTARPVVGFLGPNAFRSYRVEIDYAAGAIYFEPGAEPDLHDMDLVGLTLRPEPDGSYQVIGVARRDGPSPAEGIEPGDTLLRVGSFQVTGATMGSVVDALRGRPGERRTLTLERGGRQITVEATVQRWL
jgi:hypothetical protein